ncbi:alpha/beta hydrolase [Luteimonas vadosa]|uniref:alpha/beta fold hydrolase n=1 Tax=Luteimonas vadosa TaxID=1165507 RepID=UPI0031F0B15C
MLVALATAAWWLYRDPYRLIRAEFARQRLVRGFVRREAVIDGCRWVHVEGNARDSGAPTLVMLHGYTGSKENWYRLADALGRRYRLVAPDLPGWGESERVAGAGHGFAAQAGRVAGFLREVAEGPVVLMGHSMGGGIAAVVAARHPDLVSHLVLLDAAGVEFAENRFAREVLDGGNPFAVHDADSLERYLSFLFHRREARPPMPWPAGPALIAHRRQEAAFEQAVLDEIGRGEEQFLPGEEAARIRQPTLLAWGEQDQVIDPGAMGLYAARIPRAQALLVPDAGHMALLEAPEVVAAAVRSLVEGVDRPASKDARAGGSTGPRTEEAP